MTLLQIKGEIMFNELLDKLNHIWTNHKKCVIGGAILFILGALIF